MKQYIRTSTFWPIKKTASLLGGHSFVVGSLGRSGSTMLSKALSRAIIERNLHIPGNRLQSALIESVWDLSNLPKTKGRIFKTHDFPNYPPFIANSDLRAVFIYSNPLEIVESILHNGEKLGIQWLKKHFSHFNTLNYENFSDILDKDVLQLERQFKEWHYPQKIPHATVRLDSIWKNHSAVEEFLGIKFKLPPHRPRRSYVDFFTKNELKRLENTYESLIQLMDKTADFQIWDMENSTRRKYSFEI